MTAPLVDTERAGAELEAGLDALDTAVQEPRAPLWRVALDNVVPPLVALGSLLLVWQLVVVTKDPQNLPSPHEVWTGFGEQWDQGRIQEAVRTSLERGGLGFVFSVIVATPIGLLLARVRILRRAFQPVISGLQSLPSVAWVPLAILWFQLGEGSIYFVVLMGAIPSIVIGTISGIDQVPPLYTRVGHVLGARGLTLARHVLLPAALPGYLGGLKQGWAFSWRSLMAAELIVNSSALGLGLGQVLQQARDLSDTAGVIVGIFAILVVGLAVDLLLFAPVERRVLRRRGLLTAR
ncbi:MAG: sulfate transporter permease [Frankiales bacterium]|nr:sulfate transporter permease [Frankiales bacterium]